MANKVERLAQQFWRISMAFENRPEGDDKITASSAARELGQALTQLNPERVIAHRMGVLQQQIITGGKPQCQTITDSRLIPLTKA